MCSFENRIDNKIKYSFRLCFTFVFIQFSTKYKHHECSCYNNNYNKRQHPSTSQQTIVSQNTNSTNAVFKMIKKHHTKWKMNKKIELNWVECYAIGWIFIVVLWYFVHCVMVMLWVSVSLVHVHFKHVWAWCFPWRWNMKEKCACVQFVYSPCENRIANSIVLKKNDSKKDSNDIELHLCNAVASYRMHGLFFVSVAIVANEKQFAKWIQWMNKKCLFFTLFFLTDKIKESTSLDWTRKVKILKNKNLFFKLVR